MAFCVTLTPGIRPYARCQYEYASNNDYVINFSCMSDPKKHYVRKHTDDDDIAPQYAMVLGDCTGGELKLWRA